MNEGGVTKAQETRQIIAVNSLTVARDLQAGLYTITETEIRTTCCVSITNSSKITTIHNISKNNIQDRKRRRRRIIHHLLVVYTSNTLL